MKGDAIDNNRITESNPRSSTRRRRGNFSIPRRREKLRKQMRIWKNGKNSQRLSKEKYDAFFDYVFLSKFRKFYQILCQLFNNYSLIPQNVSEGPLNAFRACRGSKGKCLFHYRFFNSCKWCNFLLQIWPPMIDWEEIKMNGENELEKLLPRLNGNWKFQNPIVPAKMMQFSTQAKENDELSKEFMNYVIL